MNTIKWGKGEVPGRVSITAPFHGGFVRAIKKRVPGSRWDGYRWNIDQEEREHVVKLLDEYYSGYVWHRVEWELTDVDRVVIDDCRIISFGNDWWNPAVSAVTFTIIEESLKVLGSRRYPRLHGRLVIEAAFRPGSDITPEPISVETIGDPVERNPLAHYPIEMLLAEIERRKATDE